MATPFAAFLYPSQGWWFAVPFVAIGAGWLKREDVASYSFAAFWLLFLVIQLSRVPWPVSFILPLVMVIIASRFWAPARVATAWLRWGKLDRTVWRAMVPTMVVSSVGLLAWFVLWTPDVSDIVDAIPAGTSALTFAAFALAFSVLNATWEEFLLKGVMWDSLRSILPEGYLLNGIQSLFFGLIHYHGFPRGVAGVAMAAFYGFLLGIIRQRSHGMGAVIVTHTVADLTICALLYATYARAF
jgi:hypothetical protein